MLPFGQARVRSFRVVPALPEPLQPLMEIAHNLWWTWNPQAVDLFVRLNRELWEETGHNPVRMLGQISQDALDRAAADSSFLHALSLAHAALRAHLDNASWFHQRHPDLVPNEHTKPEHNFLVAYFSAEFGLTECLQIYSGGLGVLAGDHLKSTSELAVPLVGVGLLYRNGYFHQYLNSEGWQQETYPDLDFPNQPIHRVIDPNTNQQFRVTVQLPGRDVVVGVWRCNVGRTPLYLLDTNFPENQRDDREITRNLYGGDVELRIKQEIILGVGGVRALEKLGLRPSVFHMNEGHSAFLAIERIRQLRASHTLSFEAARQAASAGHLFTTHTPVPAGIDRFAPDLVERYFRHILPDLGIDLDTFLSLGRENPSDHSEFFSMAVLALRTARHCNAVSRLHGDVSRKMWRGVWPNVPDHEVPIAHVTNGVHARSWIKSELATLYDRYLPSSWQSDPADHTVWRAVRDIPDEEIWDARQRARERMIVWARRKIRHQLRARGASPDQIDAASAALDPKILTIGFARRFATYKRASLLLRDIERIRTLLADDARPFQILIAGKSHPADGGGKDLIRDIVSFARANHHSDRVVFLEDYDMDIARRLVQGCDIWLNTPRRGMEASGTSGMKAAMNGVIHVSILDGWWDEAYDPQLGFAIGRGESWEDDDAQDEVESRALYDLLERHILTEFYDRDNAGIPRKWVRRVKRCISNLAPRFNSNRMVIDYVENHYVEAHHASLRLNELDHQRAKDLADRLSRLRDRWPHIRISDVKTDIPAQVPIRSSVRVSATIHLPGLAPDDVRVQVYQGEVNSSGDLLKGRPHDMRLEKSLDNDNHAFVGEFSVARSGRNGFSVRVLPRVDDLHTPFVPSLITWDVESDPNAASTRQVTDFQHHVVHA
ncbi:MAG: alpha-glucan family phosphorylase [Phycisphaerales bacterium]